MRELGLAAQVKFAGPAFGERKARLVRNSDVLLLPTYHAEGLPYALLEGNGACDVDDAGIVAGTLLPFAMIAFPFVEGRVRRIAARNVWYIRGAG